MSNVHVFENIGYKCKTDKNIVLYSAIDNYQEFKKEHLDSYIPYIIKDKSNQYEIGIGQLKNNGENYYIERDRVISSSSSGHEIHITDGKFFIFANEYNFNTAFNNVNLKNSDFDIDNVRSIYIVDLSANNIIAKLPNATDNKSLVVDIKTINANDTRLTILHNNQTFKIVVENKYLTLASTGQDWVILQSDSPNSSAQLQSMGSEFSIQSTPGGDPGELQYQVDPNTWGGANVFVGPNNELLLGSDQSADAYSILPTSGDYDTIINQQNHISDFVVYGTGTENNIVYSHDGGFGINVPSGLSNPASGDVIIFGNDSGNRNLFFSYDGRLGLNIPVGARPQTLAHFVNLNCQEGLRIENRTSCHTANATLYHKPPIAQIPDNTDIANINLASKNSDNNRMDYARLIARVLDYDSSSGKGEFAIAVSSGTSLVQTFISNPEKTTISNGGSRVVSANNSIGFSSANIVFSGQNIDFRSLTGESGTINAANINVGQELRADTVSLTTLPNTSWLTIAGGEISAASDTNPVAILNAPSGRLLSTDANGIIVTDLNIGDLFRTNNDIVYSAYPKRPAEACLSQLILSEDTPVEEFSIGDQISVESPNGDIMYTHIRDMQTANDNVEVIYTEDQITPSTETGILIQSINKGFTLTLEKYVNPEISAVNDSTYILLSTRPYQPTIFNGDKKNIGFIVYSDSDVPGIEVRSSTLMGNLIASGEYFNYATSNSTQPLKVLISDRGRGANNNFNTANYGSSSLPQWSGLISDVGNNGLPSYYGTYDQDGNVAEWLGENNLEHTSSSNKYIAGGSALSADIEKFNAFESVPGTNIGSGIGFRIASPYGLQDSTYISGVLGIHFVDIQNSKNIPDNKPLTVKDSNGAISEIEISELGRVPYSYRMSEYEITNNQYAAFLNAVATGTDNFGLYDGYMGSDNAGGIEKAGINPSVYTVKSDFRNKPVNFVSYLDAIRFTNWLHNGAPTELMEHPDNITESGAYMISSAVGDYVISKNQFSNYYLPDIHEWYKSAYFKPESIELSKSNTVLINIDDPIPSAILTVGGQTNIVGDLYASGISGTKIDITSAEGFHLISSHLNTDSEVEILNFDNSLSLVDSPNGTLTIGPNPTLVINEEGPFAGSWRTGFSPSKITLAADGDIRVMSPNPVIFSGVRTQDLIVSEIRIADPDDPEGTPRDFFEGPSGSILYKQSSAAAVGIPRFTYIEAEDEIFLGGEFNTPLRPLYIDNTSYLKTYDLIEYNNDNILCNTLFKIDSKAGGSFQIGDDAPNLKGALLVHQGVGHLKFELNTYLQAEGLTYHRFPKRMVYVDSETKRIRFVDPPDDIGGIADTLPTQEELDLEYSFGDTVAIMHAKDFEVEYVKLAANVFGPFDGPDRLYISHPPLFFEDEEGSGDFYTYACPSISPNANDDGGEDAPGFSGIMYSITQAATLTNGLGYGLFVQDPPATSGFGCDVGVVPNTPDAPYTFRPSSKYVLSTRPTKHTHFNAVGENIDFAIYGRTKFSYNRYYPDIHDPDPDNGELPLGLVPVFKVDANVPNAVSGSATGIFFSGYIDAQNTLPTGFHFDQIGKATINMDKPYVINSITKSIDLDPQGYNTLDYVADLSVNAYTYSSGIITDHIYLSGMHENTYVPGAALTVDVSGKIISINPEIPDGPPGPPRNVSGDPGNGAVFLRWLAPIIDGGSPIIDYMIQYSSNNGVTWTDYPDIVSSDTEQQVTDLVNEVNYIFRVAAVNQIGRGQWSLPSTQITPSNIFPGQIRDLTVSREPVGDGSVDRITLSWLSPDSAGGSPITRYIVRYKKISDGSYIERFVSISSIENGIYTDIINGIDPGPHYQIKVLAENNFGEGVPVLKISYGTDEEPEEPAPPPDPYDFGTLTFNGVCITTE